MKAIGDFVFGVIYSVQEKARRKGRKWGGILRDPSQRQQWEERLIRQGSAYRKELTEELDRRIRKRALPDALKVPGKSHNEIRNGQEICFYSLADEAELKGIVVNDTLVQNKEFFLAQVKHPDGSLKTYICRDCGDQIIGDREF
ncbi:hypothetical protein JI721_04675 [Alicyclobacillus cycloheptanicus]|uniref:Uncharacterized protein n=1 Tax=Alicyclobacillus cycloheptanicus TaxID=1457 RepID=A0ABT9XLV7_9BACL|nr:hypothetical protein [Alicyclobacillus cycloheptanicus]MDQ0191207.1 hypothetical protein [Alicyclobacillus cycloheptanicus]WDM02120.1 hypothetical protein JI721_04675 [Alicyclobacillus cycloheptanicus]